MTKQIKRHPDAATLVSYAAGSLSEGLSATVAAHLSMCAACRQEVRDMELIGAALLSKDGGGDDVSPISVPALPQNEAAHEQQPVSAGGASELLPAPIAERYDLAFDRVPWKRLGPGIWHHRLALSPGVEGDLRLLKISAGRRMPEHGHGGTELTLVLDGSYCDETGEYRRGDVQDIDDDVEHRPVADSDVGCICLIASEKPARFKGLVERLIQPWTGM